MKLNINDTFNTKLPVDFDKTNTPREVYGACCSLVMPKTPPNPSLVHVSEKTATLLGITKEEIMSDAFLNVFSGKSILPNTNPYAMAYGGHQFGHWAGQLGDGRAINLAEVVHKGHRNVMQLKGAGKTPYSRSGDGLAVLRSSVREHLCSEAMHALGIPTTRSLSLMLTGESVLRDMFYDGNAAYEKGAIVCRVAPSFIRFGNFQLLAERGEDDTLTQLLDYTIEHFYPELNSKDDLCYNQFFQTVVESTLELMIHWQRVGFVHGVMNSDNMSILGLTIDYGPYGWVDDYNHDWTPNTTDRHQRRYRFGHQPQVALWNLWQLANSLLTIIGDTKELEASLQWYQDNYAKQYRVMMLDKLGLSQSHVNLDVFISELESLLQTTETDMTIFFRQLSALGQDFVRKHTIDERFIIEQLEDALYSREKLTSDSNGKLVNAWVSWFMQYQSLIKIDADQSEDEMAYFDNRCLKMNQCNPKYVLRNYMAQLAIDEADQGRYGLIEELYALLQHPYDEQKKYEKWFAKRPDWAKQKAGCSMLSCSS